MESTIGVTNVSTLERKWGIGCDDGYFSVMSRSPAIRSGVLYASSAGSKLTAYNSRTGQPLWQFGGGNYGWAPPPTVSAPMIWSSLDAPTGFSHVSTSNSMPLKNRPGRIPLPMRILPRELSKPRKAQRYS